MMKKKKQRASSEAEQVWVWLFLLICGALLAILPWDWTSFPAGGLVGYSFVYWPFDREAKDD